MCSELILNKVPLLGMSEGQKIRSTGFPCLTVLFFFLTPEAFLGYSSTECVSLGNEPNSKSHVLGVQKD